MKHVDAKCIHANSLEHLGSESTHPHSPQCEQNQKGGDESWQKPIAILYCQNDTFNRMLVALNQYRHCVADHDAAYCHALRDLDTAMSCPHFQAVHQSPTNKSTDQEIQ